MTTWTPPPPHSNSKNRPKSKSKPLPPHWTAYTDPNLGQVYYHNADTGITQWEFPPDSPAKASKKAPERMDNTEIGGNFDSGLRARGDRNAEISHVDLEDRSEGETMSSSGTRAKHAMYVCMYVYIYVCMYVCVYVCENFLC
jgi:hypothetical protein